MRTKILVASAAALAAGVLASNAQVYSANVVGYANVQLSTGGGQALIANPFDDGNGNQIANLLSGLPNKSTVITWNGAGFNPTITKTNGVWNGSVALPPGTGFFVKNGINTSPLYTNTFVGTVIPNVGGSVTNSLPAGFSLVGSTIPYSGDATTDTNINLGGTLPNKSVLITWDPVGQGYTPNVTKTNGVWNASEPIAVGQGFFINAKSAANWTQTLNQ